MKLRLQLHTKLITSLHFSYSTIEGNLGLLQNEKKSSQVFNDNYRIIFNISPYNQM